METPRPQAAFMAAALVLLVLPLLALIGMSALGVALGDAARAGLTDGETPGLLIAAFLVWVVLAVTVVLLVVARVVRRTPR